MLNLFKKKKEPISVETKTKSFTLAGVTFDNRQELIKHLKLREELKIEEYLYEGNISYKVLKLTGEQIGSIRQNDISEMQSIYKNIIKAKLLCTSAFENEDNQIIISCQISVVYHE